MKKISLIARLILGLIFFGAGLAGLLQLAPPPADLPEGLKAFMNGMMATKYFFPLLKGTETICGALLLSGFFVPLALTILAPIALNIILVHSFLAPSGIPMAALVVALEIFLVFFTPYGSKIRELFRAR